MGQEAWYVEHGMLDTPPSGQGRPLALTPMARHNTSTSMLTQQLYVPVVLQETTPGPTLTPVTPNIEARALWVTRFDWTCILPHCADGQLAGPDTIREMVANIDTAGFNMILFQVRGVGDAYYEPGLEPWSARLTGTYTATLGQDPGWDPLATMIGEAHARGIQVHAYLNTYGTWVGTSAPPDRTTPLHTFWVWSRAPGSSWSYWREWDTDHQPMLLNEGYLWASPGNEWLVEEHVVATAVDLLNRYAVDGLHLDLVRYSGAKYSCDPRSEVRWGATCFAQGDYAGWQRAQVTRLVRRIYDEAIMPFSRHLLLSVAVWWYPQDVWGMGCAGGYDDFYQDSHGWLSAGVVDAEMPMLYGCPAFAGGSLGNNNWTIVMQDWLNHRAGRYMFPGIIADMDFASIEARINAERAQATAVGAVPGHAVFSYGVVNSRGYWSAFANGPYKQRAMPPTPSWHF